MQHEPIEPLIGNQQIAPPTQQKQINTALSRPHDRCAHVPLGLGYGKIPRFPPNPEGRIPRQPNLFTNLHGFERTSNP
jgi:hypothetical protein